MKYLIALTLLVLSGIAQADLTDTQLKSAMNAPTLSAGNMSCGLHRGVSYPGGSAYRSSTEFGYSGAGYTLPYPTAANSQNIRGWYNATTNLNTTVSPHVSVTNGTIVITKPIDIRNLSNALLAWIPAGSYATASNGAVRYGDGRMYLTDLNTGITGVTMQLVQVWDTYYWAGTRTGVVQAYLKVSKDSLTYFLHCLPPSYQ